MTSEVLISGVQSFAPTLGAHALTYVRHFMNPPPTPPSGWYGNWNGMKQIFCPYPLSHRSCGPANSNNDNSSNNDSNNDDSSSNNHSSNNNNNINTNTDIDTSTSVCSDDLVASISLPGAGVDCSEGTRWQIYEISRCILPNLRNLRDYILRNFTLQLQIP